jgi:hypothetical protein
VRFEDGSALGIAVEDLKARLEKLPTDAEDCARIAKLAGDAKKRDLFNRLAKDLRRMAVDVEAMVAFKRARPTGDIEKIHSGEKQGECDEFFDRQG